MRAMCQRPSGKEINPLQQSPPVPLPGRFHTLGDTIDGRLLHRERRGPPSSEQIDHPGYMSGKERKF